MAIIKNITRVALLFFGITTFICSGTFANIAVNDRDVKNSNINSNQSIIKNAIKDIDAAESQPFPVMDEDIETLQTIMMYKRLYEYSSGRVGDRFIAYDNAQNFLHQLPHGTDESPSIIEGGTLGYRTSLPKNSSESLAIQQSFEEQLLIMKPYFKMRDRILAPTIVE